MPTVTKRYVAWMRGRPRRRHVGAVEVDLAPPIITDVPAGGRDGAVAAEFMAMPDGSGNASFAFWSVVDAHGGNFTQQSPETVNFTVDTMNVQAKACYLAPAGRGPDGGGGSGVYIDAFSEDIGDFVDDDFVASVSPDAGLTAAANDDGWVPSAHLERVLADERLLPAPGSTGPSTYGLFEKWIVIAGREHISGSELGVTKESNAVAFAFFKAPAIAPLREVRWEGWPSIRDPREWVDGGVVPWTPMVGRFASALVLARDAKLLVPELQGAVFEVAGKQILMAANDIAKTMEESGQQPPEIPPKTRK